MYVERLWCSLKQEEIYRHTYETVAQAKKGMADCLRYFNEERPTRDLTTERPTTYSSNENRSPKAALTLIVLSQYLRTTSECGLKKENGAGTRNYRSPY